MTGFRVIYWGRVWCRADFGVWVNAKVRPRWYWWRFATADEVKNLTGALPPGE